MSAKTKPSLPLKQVLEMSLRLCTSSLVSYLPLSTILEHFFFNLSKLRLFLYSNSSHLCHHSPCLQWGWLSRSFFGTLALALILPENKILKEFRNFFDLKKLPGKYSLILNIRIDRSGCQTGEHVVCHCLPLYISFLSSSLGTAYHISHSLTLKVQ